MSNLPESSTFDAGVYQLELTDPVIGGPSGISNTPLKNLANRTKYLKDHVDALESSRAPLNSPALTGNPTAPTPSLADSDTSIATTEFVKGAISQAAPDLSPYAPKANPTFTGGMTSTTDAKINGLTVGRGATGGIKNAVLGTDAGSSLNASATKNTIIGGFTGLGGGLDIRDKSSFVVLSDGDGTPRIWTDQLGRINDLQAGHKHKKFINVSSAFDNPVTELFTATGVMASNSVMAKVRVFQLAFLGSSGSSGNEHAGLAWAWSSGAAWTGAVTGMSLQLNINNTNVGSLSWSIVGGAATLRYTSNRASNYDSYYIEVDVMVNSGASFNIAMG